MGRVFVTGDTHGSSDIVKLTGRYWPEGRTLGRDDLLVICGDFGLIWSDPPDEESTFWLDWLEARPWTTLFVDGNHENHDLLDALPTSAWNGGAVHVIPGHPHILHLMRGQVYEVKGHGRWFVMGGARSQDREWRVEGRSWWSREMPSEEEYDAATARFSSCEWEADYVFTHDCPTDRLVYAMPWFVPYYHTLPRGDRLTEYLQYLDESLAGARLKGWYCGHYHDDRDLGDGRHHLLYQQVVELGGSPVADPAPDAAVAGIGVAVPDYDASFEEVARREGASMEELREFMDGKTGVMGPDGEALIYPTDQADFRRRMNARRKLALRKRGPEADIL